MKPQPLPRVAGSSRGDERWAGARGVGLRPHLFAIVLAVLLPALAFGTAAAWDAMRGRAEAAEGRIADTADALAAAIAGHVGSRIAALGVLGVLGAAEPGVGPAFRAAAEGTAERFGGWVTLRAVDGGPGFDTRLAEPHQANRPDGWADPLRPGSVMRARLEAGEAVVADLATDGLTGHPTPFVYAPVLRGGVFVAVVGMPLLPDQLSALLRDGEPTDGIAALTDSRGVLVARSRDADGLIGQRRPERPGDPKLGERGILFGHSMQDGSAVRIAYRRIGAAPGWFVWANAPEAGFEAAWRGPLATLAGGGVLALAGGLAVAGLLCRRLLRPVDALVAKLDQAEPGRAFGPGFVILEFDRVERAIREREATLRERDDEFRAAFERSPVPMSQVAADTGALLRVNEAYCALLGRSGAELVGRPFSDFVHPADREADRAGFDSLVRGEVSLHQTTKRYLRPDGSERWAELSSTLVRGVGGQPARTVAVAIDITDRRAAEAELRQTEARLRRVQRIGRVGGFEIDLRSGANLRSPEYLVLHEKSPDAFRESHEDWVSRLHPDDRIRAERHFLQTLAPGGPDDYGQEYRIRTGSGEWRWILARAEILRDANGVATRVLGAHVDITALKEAEAEQRASAAQLRAVLDSAPLGVVVAEAPSGRILLGNRRAEEILGCPVPKTVHQPVFEHWHCDPPADQPMHPLRLALDGAEVAPVELHCVLDEGRSVWLRCSAAPVRDPDSGALRGAVMVFADADAEHRAASDLAESEQRLRLALESAEIGIFVWDLRSGSLTWDARLRELWGLPHGAPVTIDTFFQGLHPDDVARVRTVLEAALEPAGGGLYRAEFRVIGKADGALRHIAAQGRVAFEAGSAVRMIGSGIDVTTMRRASEVLAREAELLEQLAERRGRALAASEARLAEAARMEALGRLAGGIAHDVNNVLQAVQSALRLVARRLERDPDAARRYLGLAEAATERGATVTRRLLSFARRGELRAEAVEPAPLLEGLAELLRPTLGPGIVMQVDAAAGLPALEADRSQLESVLVNLANNARDAMPGGGTLRLRADLPPEAARPVQLLPGLYVRLRVEDDGHGMAAAVRDRVTEPFFTTKPIGEGTGLGLAMARGFAEQSGGVLTIDSEVGKGTVVGLWLPRASEQVIAAGRTEERPEAAGRQRDGAASLVLLVEDEADVRSVLTTELEELGFSVESAADGIAALERLAGGVRPDALLTDLAMPGGMDGLAVVDALRRRIPRLPAVLLTGHVGDAAPDRLATLERTGAFAVVRKPAPASLIADRLRRVLGQG